MSVRSICNHINPVIPVNKSNSGMMGHNLGYDNRDERHNLPSSTGPGVSFKGRSLGSVEQDTDISWLKEEIFQTVGGKWILYKSYKFHDTGEESREWQVFPRESFLAISKNVNNFHQLMAKCGYENPMVMADHII